MTQAGEDIGELVSRLGAIVLPKNILLASAESCTGGMLASAIVADIDASAALERGFVTYSVDAKCELLGLQRNRVEECGGVAEDIARAMATAALDKSRADVSVAITGFAGPRESDEPVGLIHIATAGGGVVRHQRLELGDIGRAAACEEAVKVALRMLIDQASEHT